MSSFICSAGPSETPQKLFEFIRNMKGKEMRSNSVFTFSGLEELFQEEKIWIAIGKTASILLCPDTEDIVRLFYYAKDAGSLQEICSLIPKVSGRIVCDIVGREPRAGELAKELQNLGFSLYAKFQRMTCRKIEIDDTLDFSDIESAALSDAEEIYKMLHQEFDPLTARMPEISLLKERIRDLEVFVVRRDGEIAGFCIFLSNNKQAALLEYVIARPKYREQKIAKRILHYKWKYENQSQYYFLWVNSLCAGPIQFHEKNGFQIDGMYDYILLKD